MWAREPSLHPCQGVLSRGMQLLKLGEELLSETPLLSQGKFKGRDVLPVKVFQLKPLNTLKLLPRSLGSPGQTCKGCSSSAIHARKWRREGALPLCRARPLNLVVLAMLQWGPAGCLCIHSSCRASWWGEGEEREDLTELDQHCLGQGSRGWC